MIDTHTTEWHERRRKGIGGSDIAAIAGISPYKTARDVWAEKTGRTSPQPPTPAMKRGTALEVLAITEYEEAAGNADVGRDNRYAVHPELDICRVEVDAWIDGKSELTCDECRGEGTVPFTPMQIEVLANYEIKIVCGREAYWIDLKRRNISSNGRPRTRKGAHKSPPLNLPPNWTIEDVLIEIRRMQGERVI